MTHPSASSKAFDGLLWRAQLTDTGTTALQTTGSIRKEFDDTYGYQEYVYVFNNSATALADGDVVVFNDKYGKKVTSTHTYYAEAAGCAFGTIAASAYGWVQKKGYHDAIKVSVGGDIGTGEAFCMCASPKLVMRKLAAGTRVQIGFAVAADTTTSVEGYLQIP